MVSWHDAFPDSNLAFFVFKVCQVLHVETHQPRTRFANGLTQRRFRLAACEPRASASRRQAIRNASLIIRLPGARYLTKAWQNFFDHCPARLGFKQGRHAGYIREDAITEKNRDLGG